jgi:hypothetical protein
LNACDDVDFFSNGGAGNTWSGACIVIVLPVQAITLTRTAGALNVHMPFNDIKLPSSVSFIVVFLLIGFCTVSALQVPLFSDVLY